jgi:hypothetical protein
MAEFVDTCSHASIRHHPQEIQIADPRASPRFSLHPDERDSHGRSRYRLIALRFRSCERKDHAAFGQVQVSL